jgi:hypothetical protein
MGRNNLCPKSSFVPRVFLHAGPDVHVSTFHFAMCQDGIGSSTRTCLYSRWHVSTCQWRRSRHVSTFERKSTWPHGGRRFVRSGQLDDKDNIMRILLLDRHLNDWSNTVDSIGVAAAWRLCPSWCTGPGALWVWVRPSWIHDEII